VADTTEHTGFLDHLASRGYRWNHKHCAWCGKYWEPLDYRGLFTRCEGCSDDRTHNRRALFLTRGSEEPPEVRFAGVFEAARVLLEDGADEDRGFPTLAWGLEVRHGGGKRAELRASLAEASGNPEEWEHLTRDLSERTGRIRPIEVVGGVLVLERAPVETGYSSGSGIVIRTNHEGTGLALRGGADDLSDVLSNRAPPAFDHKTGVFGHPHG